jgi:hypothetical protein
MVPLIAPPRDTMTVDEVTALLRDSPDVEIGAGVELIDMNLDILDDSIATDLNGGTVQRDSYATLHGSAVLDIGRTLDWGSALVRPYATYDGVRFDLGAYFTSVGEGSSDDATLHGVQCHDILLALANRVGSSYSVAAGTAVLAKVEEILISQGFSQYAIDATRADAVTPAGRSWMLDDNTTWLTIVNDLLASVGYAGIWSDWRGRLRCEPYVAPRDRGAEWIYYGYGDRSQLARTKRITNDLFDRPNKWIAYRQNNIGGTAPVEGDGVYTLTNETIGPTSFEARGRWITAPLIMVDAVDQAALIAAAQTRREADMAVVEQIAVEVWHPMPVHWMFDRCTVLDPDYLGIREVVTTKWTLPLAPSSANMQLSWTVL